MDEIDSWDSLLAALREATWKPVYESPEGTVAYASDAPAVDQSEADWFFEEPPSSLSRGTLLSFTSDSAPGLSWSASLDVLWDDDGTAYISQWIEPIEETMHYFYARLSPGDAPALFQRLALDVMNDSSGDTFVEVASHLPDTLQNNYPDLIDKATLRAGCKRLMAARAELEDNPWSALRRRLDRRRETVASDQELSDADRERILDDYFAHCYVEQDNAERP